MLLSLEEHGIRSVLILCTYVTIEYSNNPIFSFLTSGYKTAKSQKSEFYKTAKSQNDDATKWRTLQNGEITEQRLLQNDNCYNKAKSQNDEITKR